MDSDDDVSQKLKSFRLKTEERKKLEESRKKTNTSDTDVNWIHILLLIGLFLLLIIGYLYYSSTKPMIRKISSIDLFNDPVMRAPSLD